jgi:hypothetical protein
MTTSLQASIGELWSARNPIDASDPHVKATIDQAIGLLDDGTDRVATISEDGTVTVNTWLGALKTVLRRHGVAL